MQSIPQKVRQALAIAAAERNAQQKTEVTEYFRTIAPSLKVVRDEIAKIEKEKEEDNRGNKLERDKDVA